MSWLPCHGFMKGWLLNDGSLLVLWGSGPCPKNGLSLPGLWLQLEITTWAFQRSSFLGSDHIPQPKNIADSEKSYIGRSRYGRLQQIVPRI